MKKLLIFLGCVIASQTGIQVACADVEFHGIIGSRPDGTVGTWVIGGRSVRVTMQTDLDEDHGPLKVGKCVGAEIENGLAEELENERARRCRNWWRTVSSLQSDGVLKTLLASQRTIQAQCRRLT